MQSKPLAPEDVPKFIKELEARGTYGELAIRFRHGKIMSVALTETYLTENSITGGNPRNEHHTQR